MRDKIKKIKTSIKVVKNIKNWHDYFKDYFGLIKKEYLIKMRNGIKFKIRAGGSDRFIINEIWMHKIYNPKDFEINPEDVVLDIGGHIGVFSIMAARIAKKVYVFEPVDKNFKLLIENIKLNGFKNVVPEKLALSDKNGKRKIYVSETNTGDNSLYDRKVSKTNPELIRTETLKKFIRKNKIKKIDFLKMDCEGSEYDILYNISDEIIKKIGKMVIEHHFIDNKDKNGFLLKKFLESRGFKVRMHKDMLYAKNLLLN